MNRAAQRLTAIRRALDHARRKLAQTRPEDYAQDRYYRAVLTTRQRKVRQLERLLAEPATRPAGETTVYKGYVRTSTGAFLCQLPDDSRWGFTLADDDQTWPGGFGVADEWEPVAAAEVPADVRERLDWLLED